MAAVHRAAYGLVLKAPEQSASGLLRANRGPVVGKIAAGAGIVGLYMPDLLLTVAGLTGFVFLILALGYRVCLFLRGNTQRAEREKPRESDAWLPDYTLLIALKEEAESAPQLAGAIRALDYPSHRLDVKLLIETGDHATYEALKAQDWPEGTELITVPPGLPQTKPRALNYGLARARGEFVVVYDAEDRPHPDQLRAAVRAFREAGRRGRSRLACVQAPLRGEGAQGWLAAQWALEYAVQFGRLLPGLASLGMPILLGGTSNHFRASVLKDAEGWDAWNVTEDADLGLRLARLGWRVGMIAPPTLEAPPERLKVWVAQRSRWLKGFLQTWLVVMRQPVRAVREFGIAGFVSMQLTLGAAILSALVHGPWCLWLLASLTLPGMGVPAVFLCVTGGAYLTNILMAFHAPGERGSRRVLLALTQPFYWPLQSVAMMRAIYGLCKQPHFWAKTPHGRVVSPRT